MRQAKDNINRSVQTKVNILDELNFITREGAKRNVSARDPIFSGSCVPKPLPVEDSDITGVPQAARKIKREKTGCQ